ncbi:MAG: hypothetical protein KME67_19370 [Candidatus Thiodiazotropha sp. (ex Codakia orbicularis)]|nr:hypothetical protein [Candidatus Thiodiazotropha sp. (ex Codakia orbicularis)]
MKCKGKTKSGKSCKNNASEDGFCRAHKHISPEIKKQQEDQKIKFYEVLKVFEDTCRAKGWGYELDDHDSENLRYATVGVWKGEITGTFNITVDDGVKYPYSKNSFYGHGLRDLADSIGDELGKLSWLESKKKKKQETSKKESIYNLVKRFHIVSTQLKRRYNSRDTLNIVDEYDVQDLFHALLKIYFEDVRPEEYSPSRGGASSRLDFLLKKEKIVVEVKMTSDKLTDKKIGEQLIIDIERYREHPDSDTLICFVYDPDMHIRNPAGLEKDLSRKEGALEVVVMVTPK